MSKNTRAGARLELPELSLPAAKRAVILEALRRCDGHAEEAAALLSMGASTMYRLINEFKITDAERYDIWGDWRD